MRRSDHNANLVKSSPVIVKSVTKCGTTTESIKPDTGCGAVTEKDSLESSCLTPTQKNRHHDNFQFKTGNINSSVQKELDKITLEAQDVRIKDGTANWLKPEQIKDGSADWLKSRSADKEQGNGNSNDQVKKESSQYHDIEKKTVQLCPRTFTIPKDCKLWDKCEYHYKHKRCAYRHPDLSTHNDSKDELPYIGKDKERLNESKVIFTRNMHKQSNDINQVSAMSNDSVSLQKIVHSKNVNQDIPQHSNRAYSVPQNARSEINAHGTKTLNSNVGNGKETSRTSHKTTIGFKTSPKSRVAAKRGGTGLAVPHHMSNLRNIEQGVLKRCSLKDSCCRHRNRCCPFLHPSEEQQYRIKLSLINTVVYGRPGHCFSGEQCGHKIYCQYIHQSDYMDKDSVLRNADRCDDPREFTEEMWDDSRLTTEQPICEEWEEQNIGPRKIHPDEKYREMPFDSLLEKRLPSVKQKGIGVDHQSVLAGDQEQNNQCANGQNIHKTKGLHNSTSQEKHCESSFEGNECANQTGTDSSKEAKSISQWSFGIIGQPTGIQTSSDSVTEQNDKRVGEDGSGTLTCKTDTGKYNECAPHNDSNYNWQEHYVQLPPCKTEGCGDVSDTVCYWNQELSPSSQICDSVWAPPKNSDVHRNRDDVPNSQICSNLWRPEKVLHSQDQHIPILSSCQDSGVQTSDDIGVESSMLHGKDCTKVSNTEHVLHDDDVKRSVSCQFPEDEEDGVDIVLESEDLAYQGNTQDQHDASCEKDKELLRDRRETCHKESNSEDSKPTDRSTVLPSRVSAKELQFGKSIEKQLSTPSAREQSSSKSTVAVKRQFRIHDNDNEDKQTTECQRNRLTRKARKPKEGKYIVKNRCESRDNESKSLKPANKQYKDNNDDGELPKLECDKYKSNRDKDLNKQQRQSEKCKSDRKIEVNDKKVVQCKDETEQSKRKKEKSKQPKTRMNEAPKTTVRGDQSVKTRDESRRMVEIETSGDEKKFDENEEYTEQKGGLHQKTNGHERLVTRTSGLKIVQDRKEKKDERKDKKDRDDEINKQQVKQMHVRGVKNKEPSIISRNCTAETERTMMRRNNEQEDKKRIKPVLKNRERDRTTVQPTDKKNVEKAQGKQSERRKEENSVQFNKCWRVQREQQAYFTDDKSDFSDQNRSREDIDDSRYRNKYSTRKNPARWRTKQQQCKVLMKNGKEASEKEHESNDVEKHAVQSEVSKPHPSKYEQHAGSKGQKMKDNEGSNCFVTREARKSYVPSEEPERDISRDAECKTENFYTQLEESKADNLKTTENENTMLKKDDLNDDQRKVIDEAIYSRTTDKHGTRVHDNQRRHGNETEKRESESGRRYKENDYQRGNRYRPSQYRRYDRPNFKKYRDQYEVWESIKTEEVDGRIDYNSQRQRNSDVKRTVGNGVHKSDEAREDNGKFTNRKYETHRHEGEHEYINGYQIVQDVRLKDGTLNTNINSQEVSCLCHDHDQSKMNTNANSQGIGDMRNHQPEQWRRSRGTLDKNRWRDEGTCRAPHSRTFNREVGNGRDWKNKAGSPNRAHSRFGRTTHRPTRRWKEEERGGRIDNANRACSPHEGPAHLAGGNGRGPQVKGNTPFGQTHGRPTGSRGTRTGNQTESETEQYTPDSGTWQVESRAGETNRTSSSYKRGNTTDRPLGKFRRPDRLLYEPGLARQRYGHYN